MTGQSGMLRRPPGLSRNLKQFNIQMLMYFGTQVYFFSPTATETNGVDWARQNAVGTGAFILQKWQRDSYMSLVKNPNYWRPGRPYLDKIEATVIPDVNTGAVAFEKKEIDYWLGRPNDAMLESLLAKGAQRSTSCYGYSLSLLVPDSNNPDSPFAKKEVRQAVEYAMDRKGYESVLGKYCTAAYQAYPPIAPLYDSSLTERTFDPEKARQLLEGAGYPAGSIKTKLTYIFPVAPIATALQSNLADVGITLELDQADMGRYQTMVNQGWDGLIFGFYMITSPDRNSPFLSALGPLPTIPTLPSMFRSAEYLALCDQIQKVTDSATQIQIAKQMLRLINEETMVIPIFAEDMNRNTYWPYYHPALDSTGGFRGEWIYDAWIEEH
jgi:ABC-type transport system substrate-binding protein